MREIKFRAWDKSLQRMYSPRAGKEWYELHFEPFSEIMQYTGLKDKNGVEIYEGDIVEFAETGTRISVEYRTDGITNPGYTLLITTARDSEVIGNIYENPELLDGGEK